MVKKRKVVNAGAVAATAIRILQDERLRAQLMEAGTNVAGRAKAWNESRRDDVIDLEPVDGSFRAVDDRGGRFHIPQIPIMANLPGVPSRDSIPALPALPAVTTHQKLQVRVDRLEAAIELLRASGDSETMAAFDGVDEAIERLSVALAVAQKLPRGKRAEVRGQVRAHLEDLEQSVRDATIGSSPSM